MITIERDHKHSDGRFSLKFSAPGMGWIGYRVSAPTTKAAGLCVEHYYQGHGKGRRLKNCPLCQRSAEEQSAGRTKA
jgi:hypothetical protein